MQGRLIPGSNTTRASYILMVQLENHSKWVCILLKLNPGKQNNNIAKDGPAMLMLWYAASWFPQDGGFCNHGSDNVWIHVWSWPPVLEIPFPGFLSVPSDTNGCPTVCNSLFNSCNIGSDTKWKCWSELDRTVISAKKFHAEQVNMWFQFYPFEGVDIGSLMSPSETTLIAFSISSNVFFVP